MSGINEFNSIQPEELNQQGPDKKTGKRFLVAAILTALFITGVAAVGYTMNFISKVKDDPYGVLIEQVAKEINLNEQQKSEVNRIKDNVNAKLENRKIKRVKSGREIEALFRSDTFDRSKALSIANQQDKADRDVAVYMVDELEKLHGLLTAEQRNSAVDKVKELYSKYKNMKRN